MSHYLVGVVVNDISEVDDVLAPYDENMEVEPYIYRTKAQIIADGKARKERYAKDEDGDKEVTMNDAVASVEESRNRGPRYKNNYRNRNNGKNFKNNNNKNA